MTSILPVLSGARIIISIAIIIAFVGCRAVSWVAGFISFISFKMNNNPMR